MEEKLTGKIRYRSTFFKKLILQVEVQIKWNDRVTYDYYWRDAKIEDILIKKESGGQHGVRTLF